MIGRAAVIVLCNTAVLVTAVTGQQLTRQQSDELRADLQAGNVAAATLLGRQQCGAEFDASRNEERKVSERATLAREALQCARMIAAASVALAPSEQTPQVRTFLDAWLSTYERNLQVKESENEFLGLRWGLGIGASTSLDTNVSDAVIVNDTVRQLSDTRDQPRALFEYHKLFWCNKGGTVGTRGCGPFVAVSATENKVLSGVAFGLLYGWKTAPTEPEGFSVGLGAVLDSKVKDLGDGFRLNEPAPPGETAVRFGTRSRWSILLFVTRGF